MAEVTIGLPVYNGSDYLDKALEALCAQTYEDLEILISDNASTDDTPQIIEKWATKDKRITYKCQSENIGAGANYQWVLNNAKSKFYCFGAHDDLWSPNFIEDLYAAFTANPHADLIAPRMVVLKADGTETRHFPYVDNENASQFSRIRKAMKRAHDGWYYGMYNRDALLAAFEQVKAWDNVWGQDYMVILPFILAGKTAGSDEAIYYKRQTQLSDERYRPQSGADQWRTYEEALREAFKILEATDYSRSEKLSLSPAVMNYVRKIQKPKRAILAVMRDRFAK